MEDGVKKKESNDGQVVEIKYGALTWESGEQPELEDIQKALDRLGLDIGVHWDPRRAERIVSVSGSMRSL
jgi:hypothetical protein